jgi:hypothetical protein
MLSNVNYTNVFKFDLNYVNTYVTYRHTNMYGSYLTMETAVLYGAYIDLTLLTNYFLVKPAIHCSI